MLNLFNQISATNSPREKVELLKEYPYQAYLKDVLRLALDPFTMFGITDFPHTNQANNEEPFDVLKRLSRRELTGDEARMTLAMSLSHYSEEEKEIFRRILRKDLRCGLGPKTVLSIWPQLFTTFDVMRAEKFDRLRRGDHFIEPKIDGLRCLAIVRGQLVLLLSRNGLEFTSAEHLKPQILELVRGQGDCVLDGELTSGNFNESSSAIRRGGAQGEYINYSIFDFLHMEEWKNPVERYSTRRYRLEQLNFGESTNLLLVPSYRVNSEEEVLKMYGFFLDKGYEGGMVKRLDGLYRKRKHRDWMKLKEIKEVDLVVESLVQGEGKYHGMLGALICKFNGKRVSIGAGMSDEERELWWKNPNLILRKVIEVHYHQVTPDGSLRHPRLHAVRWDKDKP